MALIICLKNTLAVSSSNFYYFCTYCSSSPPCRYYIIMATCMFLGSGSCGYLYHVVMFEGFQSFRLHENAIDFSCSAYLISFNNFDGKLLSGLFVLGQKDLSEPTFSQFLHHFVLPEATGGIKNPHHSGMYTAHSCS